MEFSASVSFIHKESVTIHGHTIIKLVFEHGLVINGFGENFQLQIISNTQQ